MWTTRQTVEESNDKELYIKTTLRELVVYLLFLVVLCICKYYDYQLVSPPALTIVVDYLYLPILVTFGMTSSTMFYYTKVMTELFLDSAPPKVTTFRGITHPNDIWTVCIIFVYSIKLCYKLALIDGLWISIYSSTVC